MWFLNNPKGLFLPAAGYRGYTEGSGATPTYGAGTSGRYWSSDPFSSSSWYILSFGSGYTNVGYINSETSGFSVRCVKGTKQ